MSRRRGLVLGAGGLLGAAWTLGALAAVQDNLGWDAREADLMVGTSAGSVLTGLLRAGMSVSELYDVYGERAGGRPVPFDLTGEPPWPGLPEFGVGSPPLMSRVLRSPLRFSPAAVCAALLPRGRRPLTRIGELIESAGQSAGQSARWPTGTWVVAMNYETGARVAFGRPDSPRTELATAVMASCAVPTWYAPVRIGRVPYVDGAVCSPTNTDLLAEAELDEVVVLAPMASVELDRPHGALTWLERRWRRAVTRRLQRELETLRARGTHVRLLTPNAADLAAMGANMMDGARQHDVLRIARASVHTHLTTAGKPVLAGRRDTASGKVAAAGKATAGKVADKVADKVTAAKAAAGKAAAGRTAALPGVA
jgi:NTE family protein